MKNKTTETRRRISIGNAQKSEHWDVIVIRESIAGQADVEKSFNHSYPWNDSNK